MIEASAGDSHRRALATDISLTGVRLRTTRPLKVAQTFWVQFADVEDLQVSVLWVDGYTAGCRFTAPLPEHVLDQIVSAASAAAVSVTDRRAEPR